MKPIQFGDYVLATKYRDGNPGDPWEIGRVTEIVMWPGDDITGTRYGLYSGLLYRRARRITLKRGAWLVDHIPDIERGGVSLWGWLRMSMKVKSSHD